MPPFCASPSPVFTLRKVTWESIAGLEQAKSLLEEAVVLPLVMPEYFQAPEAGDPAWFCDPRTRRSYCTCLGGGAHAVPMSFLLRLLFRGALQEFIHSFSLDKAHHCSLGKKRPLTAEAL